MRYDFPAVLERQNDGRVLVRFPDLPEALTDDAEALGEAADCLSEALAARILDGLAIPAPSPAAHGLVPVAPDATIALKAALHERLREQHMTVADLALLLDIEYRQAARLIDPRSRSKLTSLEQALAALGCEIGIEVRERSTAAA